MSDCGWGAVGSAQIPSHPKTQVLKDPSTQRPKYPKTQPSTQTPKLPNHPSRQLNRESSVPGEKELRASRPLWNQTVGTSLGVWVLGYLGIWVLGHVGL